MEWLLGVGQAVAKRARTVPASPVVRLHDR